MAVLGLDQLLGVDLHWQTDSVLLAVAIEALLGLELDQLLQLEQGGPPLVADKPQSFLKVTVH